MPTLALKLSILTHLRLIMIIFYAQRAILYLVQGVQFDD